MVNKEKIEELDSHWNEVMHLAEKYGFICHAYAGTATLATHKNQVDALGEEKYLYMQREKFRKDMSVKKDEGCPWK